ncbi:MAG: NERD domain-containing protein, partial [Flavobacterium sp.]
MCIVYNSIGSLREIKSHLNRNGINDFHSVKELLNFQKSYSVTRQHILSNHSNLIEQEKSTLREEIANLNDHIRVKRSECEQLLQLELNELEQQLEKFPSTQPNIFKKFTSYLAKRRIRKKIKENKRYFDFRIDQAGQEFTELLAKCTNRYQYIISHFEKAVDQSSLSQLQDLDRKKRVIEEVNSSIYGAIGEQKVVRELQNLSDDYILINDFTCSFQPPIYYRQGNEHIKTIQIDHLLISPAGVFLIETKNWSEKSLNSVNLRSPIEQIKRASFALFKILSAGGLSSTLVLNEHHWG